MRTGRNMCVSFLTTLTDTGSLRYHAQIFAGAAYVLAQHGYMTELLTLQTAAGIEKALRNTDGVFFSVTVDAAEEDAVRRSGVPAIWINVGSGSPDNCVDPDDRGGCRLLAGHLNGMGYRSVWFVTPPGAAHPSVQVRQDALCAALGPGVEFRVVPLDAGTIAGLAAAIREGRLSRAVTVTYSDTQRLLVERMLLEAGARIPEDIGTATCHGGSFGSTVARMLPTTDLVYGETELGSAAARMLLDRLARGGASVPSILIPETLVVGRSTRPQC
jgi:DNA-binding LacI/PurR family transcriptional regulator